VKIINPFLEVPEAFLVPVRESMGFAEAYMCTASQNVGINARA
jgi:hypothetical protein